MGEILKVIDSLPHVFEYIVPGMIFMLTYRRLAPSFVSIILNASSFATLDDIIDVVAPVSKAHTNCLDFSVIPLMDSSRTDEAV